MAGMRPTPIIAVVNMAAGQALSPLNTSVTLSPNKRVAHTSAGMAATAPGIPMKGINERTITRAANRVFQSAVFVPSNLMRR